MDVDVEGVKPCPKSCVRWNRLKRVQLEVQMRRCDPLVAVLDVQVYDDQLHIDIMRHIHTSTCTPWQS